MIIEPKLRFKEFSGSWSRESLGALGTFKGGGTPESQNKKYWNGDIPWISSSDISEDNLHNINISRKISDEAISSSATKLIPKDSILFVSRVGVGKLAINSVELCTSQDFVNFITKKNILFIGYYFLANKKYLTRYSQGTSIKGITSDLISSFKINLPGDNAEQQKIASFLSSVDKKIELLAKKHELLEKYKKGLMQKIFSQEIRFKQDDGSDFPDWESFDLGSISDVYQSKTISQQDLTYEGFDVYGANGIIGKYSKYNHEEAQIAIGCRGTCGKVNFTNPKSWITGNAMVVNVESSKNVIKLFLYQLLKRTNFTYLITGGAQPQITGAIKKHKIELPSKVEQQKIASFLSALDKKIDLTKQQKDKTQTFKKGLFQQIFV